MSKSNKNRERREVVEQMRRQAKAAERKRTLFVFAVCAVVAALIVGVGGYAYWKQQHDKSELAKADLVTLGSAEKAAGCEAIVEKDGTGQQNHTTQPVDYATAPPSYGNHYPSPADQGVHFYTADDRPPLEVLVHNLEHGWTIVWYDDTIAGDSGDMDVLKALADKMDGHGSDPRYDVIVAPYKSDDEDGTPIPDGKHIAFTHWSVHAPTYDPANYEGHDTTKGDPPIPSFGESQYCSSFSGAALSDFMTKFPYDDAPEGFLWHQ